MNWEDRLLTEVFIIISQEQIKQEHSKKGPGLTFTYIAGLSNWALLATFKKVKPGCCQGRSPWNMGLCYSASRFWQGIASSCMYFWVSEKKGGESRHRGLSFYKRASLNNLHTKENFIYNNHFTYIYLREATAFENAQDL